MTALSEDPDKFLEIIQNERDCGIVTLEVISLESPLSAVDACDMVVRHAGFAPPSVWVYVPECIGRLHLVGCLEFDLAYGAACMSKARAGELAERFLRCVGSGNLRFFTNTYPWQPNTYGKVASAGGTRLVVFSEEEVRGMPWARSNGSGEAWVSDPLTQSTFDSGVVVVSDERAGLLWFEDED